MTRFRLFLAGALLLTFSAKSPAQGEPYKDPSLAVDQRVNDLVSRMTLDEKISQMMDVAPGIPRLGIPVYNWWNEGLHGVARADTATVFPQAIALAATFNDQLQYQVADVISTEFRAKYNYYQSKQQYGRYKGLTVWSPNINIFRDPRWGRGQETYGEDPYLTTRMGVAFIKGLQGNDPVYFKTIATPKHYVVHSGPEKLRHTFDVDVSERDFLDTYLPAFEASIKEGKAYSIMGAYNRFRGKSCSASDTLLTMILRNDWGFEGFVVSDCGAVTDVFAHHKIVKTPAEAAALAVKSGCDLECGDTYKFLQEAVEKGYITEKDIDIAVKRLFTARFKLGMFDPVDKVTYNTISILENDKPEHRQMSLLTAQQSIVLLKNDKLLPLSKKLKNVAVLGPNAHNRNVMYGNYNGFPSKSITIFEGIKNKLPNANVVYEYACDYVDTIPAMTDLVKDCFVDGLKAEFFNNRELEGAPVASKKYEFIDFIWESSPVDGVNTNDYSVRWTGTLVAPKTGNYILAMSGDDGYRLLLDNKLIIEDWKSHSSTTIKKSVYLEQGKKYDFKAEFFNGAFSANVSLHWNIPGTNAEKKALEAAAKADMVIFVGGLSPQLEGEEMNVPYEGFSGGDRTKIALPDVQTKFLQKLVKTGKPIVLVLLNGSALAINWENEKIPAIVEAWYPGQEGGTAVADVLWGDYNPAGRLPVTFYKSENQLPDFLNYDMKGRTYRYFDGEPLYPFGYGLSYTTFKYSDLKIKTNNSTSGNIEVEAFVTNTGNIDGDEVAQLYVKIENAKYPVPLAALQGFKRINLKAKETKKVQFVLTPAQLSQIDDNNNRLVLPGVYKLMLGGSSPLKDGKNMLLHSVTLNGEAFKIE